MRTETAEKAIDYYLSHSRESESRAVTFYGGEPLLRPDFLGHCIRYARSQDSDSRLRFQLTTNGTLLTGGVAELLVNLDVHLIVSLDGPPTCHDKNRVFPSGRGSAEVVLRNLKELWDRHRDYYRTHVGVACVVAPDCEPDLHYRFFDDNDWLPGNNVLLVNFVNAHLTNYWSLHKPTQRWWASLDNLKQRFYDSLIREDYDKSEFLCGLAQDPLLRIYKRSITPHGPTAISWNGSCTPGIRRLYVDCSGRFHMCERINPTLPIGDVDHGINFARIAAIVEDYRQTSESDCIRCCYGRLCPQCFATTVVDGRFDIENKRNQCVRLRGSFLTSLQKYCRIAEANPCAFDYMEDIVVK